MEPRTWPLKQEVAAANGAGEFLPWCSWQWSQRWRASGTGTRRDDVTVAMVVHLLCPSGVWSLGWSLPASRFLPCLLFFFFFVRISSLCCSRPRPLSSYQWVLAWPLSCSCQSLSEPSWVPACVSFSARYQSHRVHLWKPSYLWTFWQNTVLNFLAYWTSKGQVVAHIFG